jgi:predicted nucleic acid-binding protein
MNDVFLDTAGLIAAWDNDDQWHAAAHAIFQKLLSQGCRLITTEMVLLECGNASARRPYRQRVSTLRQSLIEEELLVVPTPIEIEQAWAAYHRSDADAAGIVDQISFCVMRRLGIVEAFTHDRHFRAAGFVPLF